MTTVAADVVAAVARGDKVDGGNDADNDDAATVACRFRRKNERDRDGSGEGSGLAAPDGDVEFLSGD